MLVPELSEVFILPSAYLRRGTRWYTAAECFGGRARVTLEPIYVRITGGLGNQLFGLAAGIEQATRLGADLVLLNGQYTSRTSREFLLEQLDLPSFVRVSDKPPAPRAWGRRRSVFREATFNYDRLVNHVEPGTLLEGYFQSPKYFSQSEDLVEKIIFPAIIEGIQDGINLRDFSALHVRRGDYLSPKTSKFHGLVSPKYFKVCIDLMERLNGRQNWLVFTDSIDVVQRELRDLDSRLSYYDQWSSADELTTLRTMAQAKNIVISNSSFSWWAAWAISRRRNTQTSGIVIAPRPWFRAGDSAMDLLLSDWISIGGLEATRI